VYGGGAKNNRSTVCAEIILNFFDSYACPAVWTNTHLNPIKVFCELPYFSLAFGTCKKDRTHRLHLTKNNAR